MIDHGLISAIAAAGIPRDDAEDMVTRVTEAIVERVAAGKSVKLPGIGSLAAPRKAVRAGFPPDTLVVRRTVQLRHGAKLEEGEPYPDPRAKPRHQSTYGGGR